MISQAMKALKQKSHLQPVKVEGVSFNSKWVCTFNTIEDFAGHRSNSHLWPGITSEKKKALLLLAYQLSKIANGHSHH